ncbi:hypothetical protein PI125_g4673 [Phytophthora idaei]|nr:hypothetical protein PI125_g4673 [Phytophthora idaei]
MQVLIGLDEPMRGRHGNCVRQCVSPPQRKKTAGVNSGGAEESAGNEKLDRRRVVRTRGPTGRRRRVSKLHARSVALGRSSEGLGARGGPERRHWSGSNGNWDERLKRELRKRRMLDRRSATKCKVSGMVRRFALFEVNQRLTGICFIVRFSGFFVLPGVP